MDKTKVRLNERQFKTQYIANFISTWVANNHDDYCARSKHSQLANPHITEEADLLSHSAWEYYNKVVKNPETDYKELVVKIRHLLLDNIQYKQGKWLVELIDVIKILDNEELSSSELERVCSVLQDTTTGSPLSLELKKFF